MAKQYDPNALLYCWAYREEDGQLRLIGTDPALADRARFFRWIAQPGGWDQREPWPAGIANAELVDNATGAASGWPGAVPLRAKPGRPRKEYEDEDERPASINTTMKRAELFEIQRRASEEHKSVSEWAAGVLRAELARGAKVSA